MSERGQEAGQGGQQPAFILIRPQMGENIGAAARAMWNFGLDHMRMTAPRDGWPNQKAVAMASGAARLLDAAMIRDTTDAVLEDLTHVYATTARPRDLTKAVMTPQEAMHDAVDRIAGGERVGVMFGPERAGLENAEIIRANTIISVPVNPAFPSLNLGQCVLLTAYEWRRATGAGLRDVPQKARPATQGEKTRLVEQLEARLEASRYFWPEDKRQSLKDNLRNMIARLDVTDADVRTLHGVFRALADRHPVRDVGPE